MTDNPIFNVLQADALLPHGVPLAVQKWIADNAASNRFAASLSSYMARHGGLTLAQWQAAHAASMGKIVRAKRRDHAATTGTAAHTAAPVDEPQQRVKLSPAARSIARSAVRNADGWADYAKARGINAADLSGSVLYAAADALGVDIAKAIADANDRIKARDPVAAMGNAAPSSASAVTGMTRHDWARVREIAKQEAEDRLKPVIQQVVIVDRDGVQRQVSGTLTHPQFDKLVTVACTRDFAGNRLNALLVGPTGTGKSFACKQLAEILGLDFHFQSQADEAFALVGYERVDGVQKITPFVQAFRDGGVCLLDEIDRYAPKATTALNAALANGRMTLDNGDVVTRHPDFVCVGSANTMGMGATHDFTAAEKMDLSVLSRFGAKITWDVCEETEDKIADAKAADAGIARNWIAELRKVRAACERLRLPYVADQRAIEAGANLLAQGMPLETVRELTYLAVFESDQKAAILSLL